MNQARHEHHKNTQKISQRGSLSMAESEGPLEFLEDDNIDDK